MDVQLGQKRFHFYLVCFGRSHELRKLNMKEPRMPKHVSGRDEPVKHIV